MMGGRSEVCALLFGVCLAVLAGCSGPVVKPQAQVDPALAATLAEQGRQALEQGNAGAAKRAWRQAVDLNPADPVVVNNLALLLVEDRSFEEATSLLERGLEHSPRVAELHYNLGVIAELYFLDLQKALVHYRRYRELSEAEDQAVAGWIADLERRLD